LSDFEAIDGEEEYIFYVNVMMFYAMLERLHPNGFSCGVKHLHLRIGHKHMWSLLIKCKC